MFRVHRPVATGRALGRPRTSVGVHPTRPAEQERDERDEQEEQQAVEVVPERGADCEAQEQPASAVAVREATTSYERWAAMSASVMMPTIRPSRWTMTALL